MAKKIILTEEQLKTILNVVEEQQFDEFYKKYQKDKSEGVTMPVDDARLLIVLGMNWCQGKENHPDCEEVMKIRSKFNLYN
jgi:hypothetical protein